jgi:hypothetical protein
MSVNTISKGKHEIDERRKHPESKKNVSTRIRKEGGGRKSLKENDTGLEAELNKLIESTTRGDPMTPLCWTTKSTYKLAYELTKSGHPISPRSVSKILKDKDYRLQSNRKTQEGTQHPDRNEQPKVYQCIINKIYEKEPTGYFDRHQKEGISR